MSDCQICFTELSRDNEPVQAQDAQCKEDTDVNCAVFRISCGHAFHTNCLLRSYRSNVRGCPICRSTAPTETVPTSNRTRTLVTEIVNVDQPLNLSLEIPNMVSVADMFIDALQDVIMPEIQAFQEVQSAAEVSQAAHKLQEARRKSKYLQKARHNLNRAKKEYLQFEHDLLEEKATCIRDVLQNFRETHFAKFDSLRRNLKRELKKCSHIEKQALEREQGNDVATQIYDVLRLNETEYAFESIARRRPSDRQVCHVVPEPSRQSFWFR